jgi:hypothetical protein
MLALIFIRCIHVTVISCKSCYHAGIYKLLQFSNDDGTQDMYFKEKEMIMLDILPCRCLFLYKAKKK